MNNHPNRKPTRYTVNTKRGIVKFSALADAMDYARDLSRREVIAEVGTKRGIVGQYKLGDPTPEFQMHHDALYSTPQR